MSLEIGLPVALVSTSGGKVSGRHSVLTMSADNDALDASEGFGSILARVRDPGNTVDGGDSDRRSKQRALDGLTVPDAPVAATVPAPAGTLPEESNTATADALHTSWGVSGPPGEFPLQGPAVEAGLQGGRLNSTKLGKSQSEVSGESVVGQEGDRSVWNNLVALDAAPAPFGETSLQVATGEISLDGATSPSQELPAETIAAPRHSRLDVHKGAGLSASLNGAQLRSDKDIQTKAAPRTTGEASLSPVDTSQVEDLSARARVAQVFKLFAQQASLSNEAASNNPSMVLQAVGQGSNERFESKAVANLERREGAGESSADIVWTIDDRGPVSTDVAASTEQYDDQSGAFWAAGDVSNAKLKLGDATDGFVEVSIRLHGKEAQLAFNTDEMATRDALQGAGHQLKELLRSDGIELSGVSVGFTGAGSGGNSQQHEAQDRRSVPPMGQEIKLDAPISARSAGATNSLDLFV